MRYTSNFCNRNGDSAADRTQFRKLPYFVNAAKIAFTTSAGEIWSAETFR